MFLMFVFGLRNAQNDAIMHRRTNAASASVCGRTRRILGICGYSYSFRHAKRSLAREVIIKEFTASLLHATEVVLGISVAYWAY